MQTPRGIWRAPHRTPDGLPYLKAITHDNRVIARATVYPWDDEEEIAAVLNRLLARRDPPNRTCPE